MSVQERFQNYFIAFDLKSKRVIRIVSEPTATNEPVEWIVVTRITFGNKECH